MPVVGLSSHFASVLAHPWWSNGLGGRREGSADPVRENHGLVLIWNIFVHDWGIPVPLNMGAKALMRSRPDNVAYFPAWHFPSVEVLEMLLGADGIGMAGEVHECIPESSQVAEIGRQIQEIKHASETLIVEHLLQHDTCVIVGQIPDHNCRAIVILHVTDHLC